MAFVSRLRSTFSALSGARLPNLRLVCIAKLSSMKDSNDNVDSKSDLCSNDNSVKSDNIEPATSPGTSSCSQRKTGLEKVIQMFERVEEMPTSDSIQSSKKVDDTPVSFASMLRRSKLIAIGKPAGRIVVGTIIETLNDDLYIDFGGKFHCVCKAPRTNTM